MPGRQARGKGKLSVTQISVVLLPPRNVGYVGICVSDSSAAGLFWAARDDAVRSTSECFDDAEALLRTSGLSFLFNPTLHLLHFAPDDDILIYAIPTEVSSLRLLMVTLDL